MPLININQNNTNNGALPPVQNSSQVNSLGENMPLQSAVSVNDTNGAKEYSLPPVQPSNQSHIDPSANLDQKLKDLNNNSVNSFQTPSPAVVAQPVSPAVQDPTAAGTIQQNSSSGGLTARSVDLTFIIDSAIREEASDIHLTAGYRPMIRVDGELKNLNAQLVTPEEMFQFCKEITVNRSDIELEKINQADLSYTYKGRRFRVNIFKMMGTFSLVARLIPSTIKTIDELQLPQITKELVKIPSGLVLLTGPTGSGKSTTLAAMLNHINTSRAEHIVTLEDPIEFVYPKGMSLIDQREKGQDFDTWTDALRAILRQDPNVVLVGEMRDYETISSTITVAETGHLVFATLHTNSASQTIDRIIDVFPENQQEQIRIQLAQVLSAVIAQRLVPMPNGGRKAVHEILVATAAVKNAIREGQTHQINNMIQTGQDFGMKTMEKSLVELIRKGIITVETAKEISIRPDELDILLNQV